MGPSARPPRPRRSSGAADKQGVTDTPDDDQRNVVNSLAKGFRVLEAFTAERPELTLSEVATLAKLDPGTAFRMLNTLVMLGYVSRVPEGRRFRLTLKVTDLGFHAIGGADLREIARPILRSLVGEVSEAASLGVLDGADVVYVDRIRAGLIRIGVDIRIGTTIPAVCSAIGQAIVAYLPAAEVKRLRALTPRSRELPALPMSDTEIKRDLADVREHGYALREFLFRQRAAHSGGADIGHRRLSGCRAQRRGPRRARAERRIQAARARAGPPRREGHCARDRGKRHDFGDRLRSQKPKGRSKMRVE